MDYKLLKLNEMIKNVLFLLLFSGFLLTFYSCVDLDQEKSTVADAYIALKIINGDTLYALGGYVSSNTGITDFTIKNLDGSMSYDFKLDEYYGYYFEKPIKDKDYSTVKPEKGNYEFGVVFYDKTAYNTTDYVSEDILAPIKIQEVTTSTADESITINWVKNSSSNSYIIKILRGDSIVYATNEIDPGYSSVIINNRSGGWLTDCSPKSKDSLEVIIYGILYESSMNNEIQSISISSEVGVVWP
jgi:hypothetical protein